MITNTSSDGSIALPDDALRLILTRLPGDALRLILTRFLSIQDISRLDVAYCNHEKRGDLLKILSNGYIVFYKISCGYRFCFVDNFLTWIGKRKINILSFKIRKKHKSDWIFENKLTNDGLVALAGHRRTMLLSFDISFCKMVTDTGIIQVAKNCPNLQSLNISLCSNITDEGIIMVAKNCLNLQSLDISSCSKVTDTGIKEVAKNCHNLQSLNISSCKDITDEGIKEVAKYCHNLQSLYASYCSNITDTGINEITSHCPNLQSLDILNCYNILSRTNIMRRYPLTEEMQALKCKIEHL